MWLGVAWWQCHGWAKHIALSMSTRASVATWIYAGAFEPCNFFWTCLYDCLQTFGTSQFRRKTSPYTMAMGSQLRTQKRDGLPPEKNIAKVWSGIHPKLCLVSQTTAARVDHDLWKGQWTSCPWGNRFKGGKGSPWVSSSEHVYFTVHSCGSFLKRSPPQYVLSGCGGSPNWLWWQHFVRPRGTDLSFLVNTHLFGHKLIIDLIHHLSKVLVACGMWHRVCESWENMVT